MDAINISRREALVGGTAAGVAAMATSHAALAATGSTLALRPPMGWNSWNSFATTINEAQALETAGIMAAKLLPFGYDIYAFVADLVMAWVLAGVLGHLGALTLRAGLISAALCWLGFVMTTLTVNNTFAHRDWRLLWIDGGHWLVALLLMGAIIGAMGV